MDRRRLKANEADAKQLNQRCVEIMDVIQAFHGDRVPPQEDRQDKSVFISSKDMRYLLNTIASLQDLSSQIIERTTNMTDIMLSHLSDKMENDLSPTSKAQSSLQKTDITKIYHDLAQIEKQTGTGPKRMNRAVVLYTRDI
jgi:hypothetical protein